MKKLTIIITIFLALGVKLNAQKTDGFFTTNYIEYREENNEWGEMPLLPNEHGTNIDYKAYQEAPIGSGLAILAGLGLAYTMRRRTK